MKRQKLEKVPDFILIRLGGITTILLLLGVGFFFQFQKEVKEVRAVAGTLTIGKAGSATNLNSLSITGYATLSGSLNIGNLSAVPGGVGNAVFSGNVGIGTTVPSALLDIAGNASGSGNLTFRGASTTHTLNIINNGTFNVQRSVGGDAGLSSALYVDTSGNVGVGTTTPGAKLDIAGVNSFLSNTSGSISISPNTNLVVTQGNVGIGTTAPSQKLDVNGNLLLEPANPYIYSGSSYLVIPNGTYFSGGTAYFQNQLQARGGVNNDGGTLNLSASNNVIQFNSFAYIASTLAFQGNYPAYLNMSNCYNDVYLRLTTDNCGTYHYLAVGPFWANGASRFDIAEVTPVDPSENLILGEIVSTNPNHGVQLHRTQTANQSDIIGIVSNSQTASMTIGGDTGPETIDTLSDRKPIALGGRVVTIVNLENGPIKIGDPISSSSMPGTGTKSIRAGVIVSKAMESFDGTTVNSSGVTEIINKLQKNLSESKSESVSLGIKNALNQLTSPLPDNTGRIITFVSVSYFDPDMGVGLSNKLNKQQQTIDSLQQQLNLLKSEIDNLKK